MPRRKRRALDPKVHPTTPERIAAWHDMLIGRLQARKTWPLLTSHTLFEIRSCPTCGRPVLRWRRFDEIRLRALFSAIRAAGGNVTLAARRLKMSTKTMYNHLPAWLRARLADELGGVKRTKEPKPQEGEPQEAAKQPGGEP